MQLPPEHSWPAAHFGPPLHVHCPDAEHPSPLAPQAVHAAPFTPQVVAVCTSHVPFEQHPRGQEAASQTQAPETHACPGAHCLPPPHVQPPIVQPSAVMPQAVHAPPLVPHADAEGAAQVVPEQHPLGHVVALQLAHVPALQIRLPQAWQAAPPVPQKPWTLPGSQVAPLQQPAHEVASHAHAPFRQCCPVAQEGPPPQVQAPRSEQPSAVAPQAAQAWPLLPQATAVAGAVHALDVQHPAAHEVAVHWHDPLAQTCPATHAALAPQRHPPDGEQLSASVGLHARHALPSVPQLDSDGVTHAPPLQHPAAHDAELHAQRPETHCRPAPHAAPLPQSHWPEVAQLSAVKVLQATHAAPEVPQVPVAGASQLAPLQHPVGQLAEVQPVQTPPTQLWLDGQPEQVEPPVPHAALLVPGRHVVPAQQPPGHDVPSHTHAPPTQRCPAPQLGPAPHAQLPLPVHALAVAPQVVHAPPAVPHEVTVWASQTPLRQHPPGHEPASQTHAPAWQTWPGAHSLPPPQVQVPPVHASARVVSHAAHATPAAPQPEMEGAAHVVPFTQQPPGQDAALHTQAPPRHCWPAPHTGPMPHWQVPMALQRSAPAGLHATQASPPKPHAPAERELHVGPEQHPVAHVAAHPVHVPAEQLSPPGQLSHMLPPLPQAPLVLPGWHALPEQQPVAHEVPSQTHAPLRQRCPTTQAPPPPHVHLPAAEQASALPGVQAAQLAPAVAQAASAKGVHTPCEEQQPSGQDVASQAHTPCEQCSPAPHGLPVPHRQAPVASQLSLDNALHVTQDAPPVPQLVALRAWHAPALQQPLGHEVPSHTQSPAAHSCPPSHAVLPPQVHCPVVAEHPSALAASHAVQALPPVPQVAMLAG